MKLNGGRSRDEILAEVESVRSDMDSTLSAIERKLTPGQLVDQGLDYLRTSGANEFVSNLGSSVKQNPIPVALVGVCLAWLMASSRNGNASTGSQSTSGMLRRATDATSSAWTGARDQARGAGRTLSDAAQTARERFDQARQSASGTAQSAYERLDQARQSVSGTVQSARQTVSDTVHSARDALSHGADVAQRQFERARGGYDWMVREQPLALGAIGIAVGALLASAAPRTRTENEWMGEASDRLTERAKEAGREQMERAGDALRSGSSPQDRGGTGQGQHSENSQAAGQVASEPGTGGSVPKGDESKPELQGGRPPRE